MHVVGEHSGEEQQVAPGCQVPEQHLPCCVYHRNPQQVPELEVRHSGLLAGEVLHRVWSAAQLPVHAWVVVSQVKPPQSLFEQHG